MKTPLYDRHVKLGAKMVDFAGWEMPIQYKSVVNEHKAVRESAGLFDVSHMGVIELSGEEANQFLEWITTGTFSNKKAGSSTYSLLCTKEGGCVDDLLIYKWSDQAYYLVVNASNREKDFSHLKKYSEKFDVHLRFQEVVILALQGPQSDAILRSIFPDLPSIKPRGFIQFQGMGVAKTGYTGEEGYEIYLPAEPAAKLFDTLIEKGATPCGLGARDTLRLEMGYALYGHELTETFSPLESVAAWAIKMDKTDFLGKNALEKKRAPVALELLERGIPRQGDLLFKNNREIGIVTSGNFSPMLQKGIALGLTEEPLEIGEHFHIQVRGKMIPCECVQLPFYKRGD